MTETGGQGISFWTLGRKVVAAHLAHVLLLIVLLGCGSCWVVWNHIQDTQPAILKNTAQAIAGIVGKDVKELDLLVERMTASDAIVKYKSSYNLQALKQHLNQYSDKFPRLSYFNADGREVLRLLDGHAEDSLSDAPDERFLPDTGMEANRIRIFTPQTASAPGETAMELAYRYVDYFDESLGSIVVEVPIRQLSTAFLSTVGADDVTIAIADDEGRIVFSSDTLPSQKLPAELQSILTQTDVGFGQRSLFGKDSFVANVRIPNLPWTVLVAQTAEIYYADMTKITWGVLIVLAAMTGGSFLLALYISRGIVRPVLMLNEKISHVSGSEDITQRVRWTSRDEFGLLADSYNRMLVRLHESHNQMVQSQEQVSYLAFHDSLTDLPNRAMLLQALESALAQADRIGGRVAVLFIDLDDFKVINDSLGHEVGDQLLRQVADRLCKAVRKNDLASRPGGDEFIVFMMHHGETRSPEQDDDHLFCASTLAQRLIDCIKKPFLVQNYETYVRTSIGISIYPEDGDNAQTLLQHADCALFHAKELGGSQYQFYSPHLSQRQQKRMSLATRLHKAVEQDEFVLFYQPVIHLEEGRIIGAEALLRWQTSQGIVPPGEFIPLAEETGLILPIGDWAINESCRQLSRWRKDGVPLPFLSINLSARQFWHGDITAQLREAIERQEVAPEDLELEVTESLVMKEPQRMEEILKGLHAKGFPISLDDFGTGYSSLSRLKQLPIGKLKIDKSFVDGISMDENSESLVTAIVQLSRNLGIQAQAEGIETAEQWRYLRSLGCEYGQGYYFSRPVPAAEIEEMIRSGRRWTLPALRRSR